MMVYRVVFDTSTLVSAALQLDSVPHRALLRAMGSCEVCASEAILQELREVLTRKKFNRYLTAAARVRFLQGIDTAVRRFVVREEDVLSLDPACRDPKDNKFLALAAVCEAEVLVSSDEDLLVLDPWRHVRVLRPANFLDLVE